MVILLPAFLALVLGFFMKVMRFFMEKNVMKTVEQYNLKTYLLSDMWNLTYPPILGLLIILGSYGMSGFFSSFFASMHGAGVPALQAIPFAQWAHEHYPLFASLGAAGFVAAGTIITFGTIHKVIRYFGYAMVGATIFALSSIVLFHAMVFGV